MTEINKNIQAGQGSLCTDGYKVCEGYTIPKEWNVVRFNSLFKRLTRKNAENNQNVLTISAQQGLVSQMDYYNTLYASENKEGYSLLHKGDFSYNKSYSSDYAYGAIKRLDAYDAGIVSPLYICFTPKEGTNSDFYLQYFEAGRFNREIYKIAQEGARNHGLLNVATEDFFNSALVSPPLAEQEHIAEILMQCDKVIELKQKRIEEEKKKKKSLLRMLTNSLDKESDYQLTNLKELCDFIGDGDWIESKDQSSEGIRLIQTGNIGVNRYLSKDDRARYISEGTFESLNCTEVFNGDLLVSRLPDPIGRVCRVEGISGRAITAVDCTILRFKSEITADWFLQFASSEQYLHKIEVLAGGSTRTRISRKELTRLKFRVPSSLQEQQKVVDILSSQDSVIWSLEAELEDWIKKKKALMQLLLTGIVRTTA